MGYRAKAPRRRDVNGFRFSGFTLEKSENRNLNPGTNLLSFFAPLRLCARIIGPGLLLMLGGCMNPFAPGWDSTPAESTCNPQTTDGMFQCFQSAYTFRDTSVYGQLIDPEFVFVWRNYDLGIDVTWGHDDEMRATYGLFQNAQKLDLIWNNIISTTAESTNVNIVRGFNLTIVFNPSDIERIDGYANVTFRRARINDPWKIVRWRDESNF